MKKGVFLSLKMAFVFENGAQTDEMPLKKTPSEIHCLPWFPVPKGFSVES